MKLLFSIFFCFVTLDIVAQSTYTDYNPQYQTWANSYQIDKIEQTATELVIHFRFARDNNKYDKPSFYPSKHEFAWVLETKDGAVYHWNRLSNIARNGVVQIADLGTEIQVVEALTKEKKSKTFFTCQIHFEALPDALTEISLVQGKGLRENRNHLNCLELQLKNENRGSADKEKERVGAFEKLMLTPAIPVSMSRQAVKELEIKRLWEEDLAAYPDGTLVDDLPVYEQSQPDYFLDKIIYTKTETIFFVRFVFPRGKSSDAIFYATTGEHPWFLKDCFSEKKYELKEVTNIKKNGNLEKEKLSASDILWKMAADVKNETVFTCQVHFEKLPNDVKRVHLIEGRRKSNDLSHFNFFDIMIMPALAKKVR